MHHTRRAHENPFHHLLARARCPTTVSLDTCKSRRCRFRSMRKGDVGWAEIKPHLGGHWDKAHYSRGVLHGARALTSNRMLPHCGFEGLSTLSLKQQRTESPPPRARVRHDTERFRCYALSAAGCVCIRTLYLVHRIVFAFCRFDGRCPQAGRVLMRRHSSMWLLRRMGGGYRHACCAFYL